MRGLTYSAEGAPLCDRCLELETLRESEGRTQGQFRFSGYVAPMLVAVGLSMVVFLPAFALAAWALATVVAVRVAYALVSAPEQRRAVGGHLVPVLLLNAPIAIIGVVSGIALGLGVGLFGVSLLG